MKRQDKQQTRNLEEGLSKDSDGRVVVVEENREFAGAFQLSPAIQGVAVQWVVLLQLDWGRVEVRVVGGREGG